jgi:peptidoglycan/xylan/chitin deacetylase (PgdA/CDA1 family)
VDNYATAFPILISQNVKASFFIATGFIDNPQVPWWDEIAWMVRTSTRSAVEIPGYLPYRVEFDGLDRERAVRTLLRTYFAVPTGQTSKFLEAVAETTGTGRPSSDAVDPRSIWMTWDMVREMHAAGMTIGGHTVSHPILSRLSREEQLEEVAGCELRLRREIGAPMRTFAYPYGFRGTFNVDSRECLRDRGVVTAFSYYGGFRQLSKWDNYDIPRIAVEQSTTFEEFRAVVMFPWMT